MILNPYGRFIKNHKPVSLMSIYIEDKGLRIYLHPQVYEPKEDSFLMSDSLFKEEWETKIIMEVGSGTGYLSLLLGARGLDSTIYAVDINYHAAELSHRNALVNHLNNILVVCGDLTTAFRKKSLPIVCIFNPPYLPEDPMVDPNTHASEYQQLIGGPVGFETAGRLLEGLTGSTHVVYLVLSSLASSPVEFGKLYQNWQLEVLASAHLGFETIWIIKMIS